MLAREIRRDFGDRFPLKGRNEIERGDAAPRGTHPTRPRTRGACPRSHAAPASNAGRCLSEVEEVEVVEQIIAALFTIPKLMGALRNPNVTDILVFGSAPVRVEELDGTVDGVAAAGRS